MSHPIRSISRFALATHAVLSCVRIVTNQGKHSENVVKFYNGRSTAEQWIKKGKNAVKWTKLSLTAFLAKRGNQRRSGGCFGNGLPVLGQFDVVDVDVGPRVTLGRETEQIDALGRSLWGRQGRFLPGLAVG